MGNRLAATLDATAAEIIRLGVTALQASAALFYWVDGAGQMSDVSLEGLPGGFYHDYAGLEALDPSNVTRLVTSGQSVTQLACPHPSFAADAAMFSRFVQGWGGADIFDLMFRAEGQAIAGIGIIKMRYDPPAAAHDLTTAGAMQRYIEFTLQNHQRVTREKSRRRLTGTFGLTAREVEVAELAAQGLTNTEIAETLRVSLPTVKSHLARIFDKTGCASRARLAAFLQ